MKRKILFFALALMISASALHSRTYEPPINFFFIVHMEPLSWGMPLAERTQWLQEIIDIFNSYQYPLKLTILMNGDVAESLLVSGDSAIYRQWEREGHELGAHAHSIARDGAGRWYEVTNTGRYGMPQYNYQSTWLTWHDCDFYVDQLTQNKHTICAMNFMCSDEGDLALEFGYEVTAGNRSEKCLDYTGHLARHPMRPGKDNHHGHELLEDLTAPNLALDHYAQIGNELAHGYNCLEAQMEIAAQRCYADWLAAEQANQDSIDNYVWTFGVLTHDYLLNDYYLEQITAWCDFLDENYLGHYTSNGNLIARNNTAWGIAQEYYQWETEHPGWSSYSLIKEMPENLKINEVMYKPANIQADYEWLEIYNPTDITYDLTNWKIRGAVYDVYWHFPSGSIAPGQYIVVANNGQAFYNTYGFYPEYESEGNTPALNMIVTGNLEFHEISDAVILCDTTPYTPVTEVNWTDVYSWGTAWHAGFCDTVITPAGHTIGRNSNSMDTDEMTDWFDNGTTSAPTPHARNYPGFQDLRINIVDNDILLIWFPSATATSYKVYRSIQPYFNVSSMTPIAEVTQPQYIDPGAASQNKYFYKVVYVLR